MTTKYGDFLEPVFNCRGDVFADRVKPGERDLGLNFKATVGKRGKNKDATFDGGVKVLFEGEKFIDSSRRKLLANAEKKKGMVSENPFRMSNPPKKSTGLGDFQGTFGGKLEYIAGSPDVKKLKGEYPEVKPNLYTSPSKKGSYGYIKTTLSEKAGPGGVTGEYTYQADPYNRAQVLEAEAKKKFPNVSDAPFRPSHPPKKGSYGYAKTNLGNKPQGSIGEFGYMPVGDGGPRRASAHFETPFVPARIARKGYNCTLNKFPSYEADPDQIKHDARRMARKLEMAAMASSNPFRPSNIPKTAATRSVMRMNL